MPSENFREVSATWLSKIYCCYHDAVLAVACYCDDVPFPWASNQDATAASPSYFISVDGDADWDLADFNAEVEPFRHNVLKTKSMEQEEARRFAYVAFISSMVDVVSFGLGRVQAPEADNVPSNDSLRRTAWCPSCR